MYLAWQHNDSHYRQLAYQYYHDSGLSAIELRRYYNYLGEHDKAADKTAVRDIDAMFDDSRFQHKLLNNQVIRPSDTIYSTWRPLRDEYNRLDAKIVSQRYGLKPGEPQLLDFVISMFLHANLEHLFSNILILLLIGYVVETILGPVIYSAGYLLAGFCGNALFMLIQPDSHSPSIGASGAIFGVLGMYLVFFGLRKIRFFFFLIYFNYFKAPAIIMLLPVIAWQLYLQLATQTNINIPAHLGGLCSGALLAFISKRFLTQRSRDYLDVDVNKEKYQQALTLGQQQLAAMDIQSARRTFENILKDNPLDIVAKQHLFNIYKLSPDQEPFHRLALQLLNLSGNDRHTIKIVHDVFLEYANRVKNKAEWNTELLQTLAIRFAAHGFMDDAETITTYLLQSKPELPRNAEVLSALAKYYLTQDPNKSERYRQLLLQYYPESIEAQHLAKRL